MPDQAALPSPLLYINPLSRAAFAAYGDVLGGDHTGVKGELINAGTTQKFSAQAPNLTGAGGEPSLHLYRSKAQSLPLKIEVLECHQFGSQTFVPLGGLPFIVVVAQSQANAQASAQANTQVPDLHTLSAFWVDGQHAVTLHAGTWHHSLIALHDSDFVVLERAGPVVDCLLHRLDQPLTLKTRSL